MKISSHSSSAGSLLAASLLLAVSATTAAASPATVPVKVPHKCPDIKSFRTDEVLQSFDGQQMVGFWYEQAYLDVAQVGARCQTLNTTYDASSGVMTTAFKVDYGKIPFTMVEIYSPDSNRTVGYFVKRVKAPGSQLLELPTVVVDATTDANGAYVTATLYSCTVKLGVVVPELVLMTTSRTVDNSTLDQMEAVAKKQGVQWNDSDLHRVDWSAAGGCP